MAVSVAEYEKALASLSEALQYVQSASVPVSLKLYRDASIRRFAFCIELAWKTSAKVLGSSSTTAKPVIREMAQNALINDPVIWFSFIEARNKTSYSYDDNIAQQVHESAKVFLPYGEKLLTALKAR